MNSFYPHRGEEKNQITEKKGRLKDGDRYIGNLKSAMHSYDELKSSIW